MQSPRSEVQRPNYPRRIFLIPSLIERRFCKRLPKIPAVGSGRRGGQSSPPVSHWSPLAEELQWGCLRSQIAPLKTQVGSALW